MITFSCCLINSIKVCESVIKLAGWLKDVEGSIAKWSEPRSLVLLEDALKNQGAACLDGSPAGHVGMGTRFCPLGTRIPMDTAC